MSLAKRERALLCDLLDEVGPDAPTLCEGWSSHDLATHLWVRESDPVAMPGIVGGPLAGLTEARMARVRGRWSYPELVRRLRGGPPRLSFFALPGLGELANAAEYLIHHEDVRRAGGSPRPPRDLGTPTEDQLWRQLRLMGRGMYRGAGVGVVLEREDGESRRVAPGSQTVTLLGRPSELLLYSFGRRGAADVRAIGEPDAVARLS